MSMVVRDQLHSSVCTWLERIAPKTPLNAGAFGVVTGQRSNQVNYGQVSPR